MWFPIKIIGTALRLLMSSIPTQKVAQGQKKNIKQTL